MDIKRLLQSLLAHKVKFLVIGAWALPAHGLTRMTQDIDIFIKPTPINARRTLRALKSVGYDALAGVTTETLLTKKVLLRQYILQADIHPFVAGVKYDEVWEQRMETTIEGLTVFVPSLETMIAMKKAAGRSKDKEDLRVLKKIRAKRKASKKKE